MSAPSSSSADVRHQEHVRRNVPTPPDGLGFAVSEHHAHGETALIAGVQEPRLRHDDSSSERVFSPIPKERQ
jgi:hypothetical protein